MLRGPSMGRPKKISMRKAHSLSVSGICPPGMAHVNTTADRADPYINVPYLPEQFCHCHASEPCLEPLMPLKREDQLQVPVFHTVIQEAVIPYFMKALRKHMHQETAYELFIRERYRAPLVTRFFTSGRK